MPKTKTKQQELEKATERLRTKIKEWMKRPGSFYLGESNGHSVIAVRTNEKFDYFDPSDPKTISRYVSKSRSITKMWKKIRKRPYIILAYNSGHGEKKRKWLVIKKEKNRFPEQIFISLTVPNPYDNRAYVQTLASVQSGIIIASMRSDHYRGNPGGEPVLFAQTDNQKWRAQIADVHFFDSILEEPNSV